MKKSVGKRWLPCLLAICSVCLIVASINFKATATDKERFIIPDEIVKTVYVGTYANVARVMPSEENAENYHFGVINDTTGELVQTDGYRFVPERAGKYKCVYSYESAGEKYEYTYLINAILSDAPVFLEEPNFPYAFVSGVTYELPQLVAYDYSDGEKKVAKVSVAAKIDGKSLVVNEYGITPESDDTGATVTITYTAASASNSKIIEKSIPVVQVYKENGQVDMTGLFYQTDAQRVSADSDKITLTTTSDMNVQFANLLSAEGLEIVTGFGANYEAERIVLRVESYYDPSVAVTLAFDKGRKASGNGEVILNGKERKKFEFSENQKLKLVIDNKNSRLLTDQGEVLFSVKTDLNGGQFTGFPDEMVKVSIKAEGVYGTCDLNIYQINLQMISNQNSDLVQPSLLTSDIGAEMMVGETIRMQYFAAVDVIDPCATVSVTASLMGTPVDIDVNENGSFAFTPEKAGSYMFRFVTLDRSGNEGEYRKVMYVLDTEKPSLEIGGQIPDTVKLNETLKLPSASASDNNGNDKLLIYVTIVYPSAQNRVIASATGGILSGAEFTFENAGKYFIRYIAVDEYENFVLSEYEIECKE